MALDRMGPKRLLGSSEDGDRNGSIVDHGNARGGENDKHPSFKSKVLSLTPCWLKILYTWGNIQNCGFNHSTRVKTLLIKGRLPLSNYNFENKIGWDSNLSSSFKKDNIFFSL